MRRAQFALISAMAVALPFLAACGGESIENAPSPTSSGAAVAPAVSGDSGSHAGHGGQDLELLQALDHASVAYGNDEDAIKLAHQVCDEFVPGANASATFDEMEARLGASPLLPANSHSSVIGNFMGVAMQTWCPEYYDAVYAAVGAEYDKREASSSAPAPPLVPKLSNGKFLVGYGQGQAQPGTYTIDQPVSDCYWERSDAQGNILDNNLVSIAPSLTVTIEESDAGFTSRGCGIWTNVD